MELFDKDDYLLPFKENENGEVILKVKFDKIYFNQIELEAKKKYCVNYSINYFSIKNKNVNGFYVNQLTIKDTF